MDPKEIEQLLKEADRGPIHRSDPAELADRVLRTIRRRRVTRSLLAVVLVPGLAGIIVMTLPHPAPPPTVAINVTPQSQPSEEPLEAIRAEIAMREAMIDRLEAMQRRSDASARLASLPAEPRENQLIEQAAAMVVYQADRLLKSADNPQPAIQAYNEVIANFPTATSAKTARQRVAELNKAG